MRDRQPSQESSFSWPPPASDLDTSQLIDLRTGPIAPHRPEPPAQLPRPSTGSTLALRTRQAVGPQARPARRLRGRRTWRGRRAPRASRWGWLAVGLVVGALLPGQIDALSPIWLRPGPTRPAPVTAAALPLPSGLPRPAMRPASLDRAAADETRAPLVPDARTTPHPEAAPPPKGPRRLPVVPRDPATDQVIGTVQAFGTAWSRSDAAGTRAVWPSADTAVLTRTFTGMREQHLTFRDCTVALDGQVATARCAGTLRYRPRVGDHATRTVRGRWAFGLRREGTTWVIDAIAPPIETPASTETTRPVP